MGWDEGPKTPHSQQPSSQGREAIAHLTGTRTRIHTAFFADESSLGSLGDSSPHGDGLRVSGVRCSLVLVVPPVPVTFEEVRFPYWFPPQSCVDAFPGQTVPQLHQTVGVAWLCCHFFKNPVFIS